MDTLKKIEMLKKGKKELSPVEAEAKGSVLKDIQALARKAMGGKLGGIKKVAVESNTPEGIKEGLKKAQEVVEDLPEGSGLDEMAHEGSDEISEEHEVSESPEFEAGEEEGAHEHEDESEEELDAKIKELLAKKQALAHKK